MVVVLALTLSLNLDDENNSNTVGSKSRWRLVTQVEQLASIEWYALMLYIPPHDIQSCPWLLFR